MNEKKVLAFLNLDKDAEPSRFMAKVVWGHNVGYSILIGATILLTKTFDFRVCIAFVISFVIVDFLLGLILIINHNPAWEILLNSLAFFFVVVKALIGYVFSAIKEFERDNIPIFTWVHLVVSFLAIWFIVYAMSKLYQAYQFTKRYSISVAQRKIAENNPVKKWPYVVSAICGGPAILIKIWSDRFEKFGLGLGIVYWSAAWLYTFMFIGFLFKGIVVIKFKAYKYFKKKS